MAAEDYDEAKRLKAAQERLRAVGAQVAALEARCAWPGFPSVAICWKSQSTIETIADVRSVRLLAATTGQAWQRVGRVIAWYMLVDFS